jgi:hypothetical protein
VEPGFLGAAASGAVQTSTFQQDSGMFEGQGSMFYDVVLLPGQTLTLDTTLTLFASGSASAATGPPVTWPNLPPKSNGFTIAEIASTSPTNCPEPGGTTLATALAVLLAGLVRKRLSTARQRSSPVRSPLQR